MNGTPLVFRTDDESLLKLTAAYERFRRLHEEKERAQQRAAVLLELSYQQRAMEERKKPRAALS